MQQYSEMESRGYHLHRADWDPSVQGSQVPESYYADEPRHGDLWDMERGREASPVMDDRQDRAYRDRDRRRRRERDRGRSRGREKDRSPSPPRWRRSRSPSMERRWRHRETDLHEDYGPETDYNGAAYDGRSGDRFYKERTPEAPSLTVVVKGLSGKTVEEDLYKTLDAWGPLQHVRVIRDKASGLSRGFAFIDFPSLEASGRLIADLGRKGVIVDNRRLIFEFSKAPQVHGSAHGSQGMHGASLGSHVPLAAAHDWICSYCSCVNFARRSQCFKCNSFKTAEAVTAIPGSGQTPKVGQELGEPTHVLVVRGLDHTTAEESLHYEFSKYAPIKELKLVQDKATQLPRGYAFIHFHSVEDSTRALEATNGIQLDKNGPHLRVAYARNTISVPGNLGRGVLSGAQGLEVASQLTEEYDAIGWAPKEYQGDEVQGWASHHHKQQVEGAAQQSADWPHSRDNSAAVENDLRGGDFRSSSRSQGDDRAWQRDAHRPERDDRGRSSERVSAWQGDAGDRQGRGLLGSGAGLDSTTGRHQPDQAWEGQQHWQDGAVPDGAALAEAGKDHTQGAANDSVAEGAGGDGAPQSGFVWDEASGYYYDAASGYYYDGNTGLYYHGTTELWYSYNEQTQQYEPYEASAAATSAEPTVGSAADPASNSGTANNNSGSQTQSASRPTIPGRKGKSLADTVAAAAAAAAAAAKKDALLDKKREKERERQRELQREQEREKERQERERVMSARPPIASTKKMGEAIKIWSQRQQQPANVAPISIAPTPPPPEPPSLIAAGLSRAATSAREMGAGEGPAGAGRGRGRGLDEGGRGRGGFDAMGRNDGPPLDRVGQERPAAGGRGYGSSTALLGAYAPPPAAPKSSVSAAADPPAPFRTDASALGSYLPPAATSKRKFSETRIAPSATAPAANAAGFREQGASRGGDAGRGSNRKREIPFPPGVGGLRELPFPPGVGGPPRNLPFPPGVGGPPLGGVLRTPIINHGPPPGTGIRGAGAMIPPPATYGEVPPPY